MEWSGHWSIKVEPWMSDLKFAQVWYQWVQIRKPTRHINTEVQVLNYQVYNQDVVSIRWTKVCQWAVSLSLREENAEGFVSWLACLLLSLATAVGWITYLKMAGGENWAPNFHLGQNPIAHKYQNRAKSILKELLNFFSALF